MIKIFEEAEEHLKNIKAGNVYSLRAELFWNGKKRLVQNELLLTPFTEHQNDIITEMVSMLFTKIPTSTYERVQQGEFRGIVLEPEFRIFLVMNMLDANRAEAEIILKEMPWMTDDEDENEVNR